MAKVTAGVELTLTDKFSQGINKASTNTQRFASGAMSAINGIDKALSGTTATLGALGVSFGAGATVKGLIDVEKQMVRMGVQAGISSEEINALKQQIYDVASSSDIKIREGQLTAGIDAIVERTGDLQFAQDSMRAIGLAMQATGADGEAIGGLFAEFQKMGLGVDEINVAMDTLYKQGNAGAFTLENLAALGPRVIAAYSATGRSGTDSLSEMGAALQVIMRGTGSADQAATAFEAVIANLTSPDKQEALAAMGVAVRDEAGEFRSITDIMKDVVEATDGSIEAIGSIFDQTAVRAFNSSIAEFQKNGTVQEIDKFNQMVGDGSAIQNAAARNAQTMAANLQALQTSFMKFADSKLAKPMEDLTNLVNDLTENPEKVEKYFNILVGGITALAAVKVGAGVVSFISNLKNIKGTPSIGGGGGLSAESGTIPVYVTNMGSFGSGSTSPTAGKTAGLTSKQIMGGGAMAALAVAMQEIPEAINRWTEAENNDSLTEKQKGQEKGGAVGDAAGSITGAFGGFVGGAKIGAMIGTAIAPGVGTAIGGALGGGIGALAGTFLGGKAGDSVGSAIGGIGKSDTGVPQQTVSNSQAETQMPVGSSVAEIGGVVTQEFDIKLEDNRTMISSRVTNNTSNVDFATGSAKAVRNGA